MKTSSLNALIDEIESLKASRVLLKELWDAISPYREPGKTLHEAIPDKLWYRVQNHFGFDDGE